MNDSTTSARPAEATGRPAPEHSSAPGREREISGGVSVPAQSESGAGTGQGSQDGPEHKSAQPPAEMLKSAGQPLPPADAFPDQPVAAENSTVTAVNLLPHGLPGERTHAAAGAHGSGAATQAAEATPPEDPRKPGLPVQMQLSVDHDEFGLISMKAVSRHDHLSASIAVESPELRGLIHAQMPALEHALAERRVSVANIELSDLAGFAGRGQSGGGFTDARQQDGRQLTPPAGYSGDGATAAAHLRGEITDSAGSRAWHAGRLSLRA